MIRIKLPKVIEQPVPALSDDELRALIKACECKRFEDRRDEAIVRLFIDTGIRLGELAGLTLEIVDLDLEVAVVLGKGQRLRSVLFGKSTTRALDRYIRIRRLHKDTDQPWLWLGLKGRLSDSGIEQMVAHAPDRPDWGRSSARSSTFRNGMPKKISQAFIAFSAARWDRKQAIRGGVSGSVDSRSAVAGSSVA